MDLIKELLDHGSQTLAAFKDNIPTLLPTDHCYFRYSRFEVATFER
jgi:hypothetical protein